MTVVLMDGSVIRTKGSNRARKSTTGWDTGRLFLGSEGTLGVRSLDCAFATGGADSLSHCPQIITELTVRLAPVVPLKVALTSFPSVDKAVTAVVDILGAGLTPTSLELLDGTSIRGLNLAKILPDELPEEPTVLMRFSNPSDEVNRASLDTVAEIVKRVGARELRVAKNEEENDELWKARKVRRFLVSAPCFRACALLLCSLCTFARSHSTGRNSFSSVQAVVPWQVLLAFSSSAPVRLRHYEQQPATGGARADLFPPLDAYADHRRLRPDLAPRRVRRSERGARSALRPRRADRSAHRRRQCVDRSLPLYRSSLTSSRGNADEAPSCRRAPRDPVEGRRGRDGATKGGRAPRQSARQARARARGHLRRRARYWVHPFSPNCTSSAGSSARH